MHEGTARSDQWALTYSALRFLIYTIRLVFCVRSAAKILFVLFRRLLRKPNIKGILRP